MRKEIGTLKLDRKSHSILKKSYQAIYGKKYDGTGIKFAIYGNLKVSNGEVTNVTWLDEKECFKINLAIENCTKKFNTIK